MFSLKQRTGHRDETVDTSETTGRQTCEALLLGPVRGLAGSRRSGPRSQALRCGLSQTGREKDGHACLCAKTDALLLGAQPASCDLLFKTRHHIFVDTLKPGWKACLGAECLPSDLPFWATLPHTSVSSAPPARRPPPAILHRPARRLPALCPMNPGHPAIPLPPPSALPLQPPPPPSSDLSGGSWRPSRTPYLGLLEFAEHSSCGRFSLGPDTG